MERSVLNEYGVIGSLLLDPSLFPQASGLAAEDFALEPLRAVFRAMRRQYSEMGTFDALTVRAETGASCPDVTDELLVRTLETTPTAANLSAYIAAVREASLGRKLSALGAELLDAELAPTEALNRAQEAIQRMAEQGGTGGEGVYLTDALSGLCDRVERQAEGKAPCVPSGLAGGSDAGRRVHQRRPTHHRRTARCGQERLSSPNYPERRPGRNEGRLHQHGDGP